MRRSLGNGVLRDAGRCTGDLLQVAIQPDGDTSPPIASAVIVIHHLGAL